MGQSRGGGVIRIVEVDGFPADFSASLHTLIIDADDRAGLHCLHRLRHCPRRLQHRHHVRGRKGRNDAARQFIEMDSGIKDITLDYLRQLSWVHQITYIPTLE